MKVQTLKEAQATLADEYIMFNLIISHNCAAVFALPNITSDLLTARIKGKVKNT